MFKKILSSIFAGFLSLMFIGSCVENKDDDLMLWTLLALVSQQQQPDSEENTKPPVVNPPVTTCKVEVKEVKTKDRWYLGPEGGYYTYWRNQKLVAVVENKCESGKYQLVLSAKNIHGPLPIWYKLFIVAVKVNEELTGVLKIGASDIKTHATIMNVKLKEGINEIVLVWKNDAFKRGKYDANICLKKIEIKKL